MAAHSLAGNTQPQRLLRSVLDVNALHLAVVEGAIVVVRPGFSDLVNRVHTVNDSAESSILTVKEEAVLVTDEKLGACRIRILRPCHGDHAALVLEIGGNTVHKELALDLVLCAAHAGSLGISALDHEILDDSVEYQTVVEAVLHQLEEVLNSDGSLVGVKLQLDLLSVF